MYVSDGRLSTCYLRGSLSEGPSQGPSRVKEELPVLYLLTHLQYLYLYRTSTRSQQVILCTIVLSFSTCDYSSTVTSQFHRFIRCTVQNIYY